MKAEEDESMSWNCSLSLLSTVGDVCHCFGAFFSETVSCVLINYIFRRQSVLHNLKLKISIFIAFLDAKEAKSPSDALVLDI